MRDIIEIVESLEDSDLLLKGVCEIIQNEAKEQKGRFLSMLLGTLGVSLLRNILAGKEKNKAGEGVIVKSVSKETMSNKQDLGIITAGYGNKKRRKTPTKRQGNKNKMDF